ncbi:MAG: disulfide bond formation protein B [Gaiellales bacterium]
MTEVVQNFYALASIVLAIGAGAVVLCAIASRFGRPWFATIAESIRGYELWIALVIAAFAMGGSLYFSEVANYIPCPLCWYQRIAMYPLVALFLVAGIRRDHGAAIYGLVLSLIGAGVALYHYQLEWFPDQAALCKQGSLCHVIWFRALGFATIPYLSFVAFCVIATVCAIGIRNRASSSLEHEGFRDAAE